MGRVVGEESQWDGDTCAFTFIYKGVNRERKAFLVGICCLVPPGSAERKRERELQWLISTVLHLLEL